MRINVSNPVFTHEGAPAVREKPLDALKRTVLACMLFEDNFYESGVSVADRITQLCAQVKCDDLNKVALLASEKYLLRHVPLKLIVEALKHKEKGNLSEVIGRVCRRPDQITDLLALYWKDGRKSIPRQLKKGMQKAFVNWDEYQLAKYNRDNPVKLRDALFLAYTKPLKEEHADLWKRLVNDELKVPDTWETRLSSGADKKESFEELLRAKKMGKLAILRNLRNMIENKVPKELVASELNRNTKEMLPFQYLAAARECPQWEDIIDAPMIASSALKPKLNGKTILLIDVSGSMDAVMSAKSVMTRLDAACGMAILLRECCPDTEIYTFSDQFCPIPPRHGMALRDAIVKSQVHSGTYMGKALSQITTFKPHYDRLIVITDEQSHDPIPMMLDKANYILNMASYQNGVGRKDRWITITGFSEASIDFIRELENFE